ncbi:MAG: C4-dicarboxylate ABC transporter substrate-binding protein [Rhodospirillaceae bacterium]|nr:C4-dicarboxylate ABC transporter substrate-binding protein [Rhodospirillaceae bacterium]|tara:strand:+ start:320 stop:1306 length:987 start_codon:yes stop_codon:yes gene_type:complete
MKFLSKYALATSIFTIFCSSPLLATELKVLSSWNKNIWPTYVVLDTFVKNVEKIGGGKVKLKISGPEVVPAFQQLQPVKSGVFDILFTHGAYHAGAKGLAVSIDAMLPDPVGKRLSGVWDKLDKFYQEAHGLKLLAAAPASTHGYHMFLKEPLSKSGDFQGRKIRGTQTYFGVIKLLGGQPVVLPGSQVYSALEKGVVDGAAWPSAGMLNMKHYEVAKHKIRPTFGTTHPPVFMNLKKYKSLTQANKSILLSAGYQTELEMPWIGDALQAKEDSALAAKGVKITKLSSEKAAKLRKTFSESLWKQGEKCCGSVANELRALSEKAGLSQ